MPAGLVLKDGTRFDGTRFGSPTPMVGEIVLYTGVVGWQEILTDPAYAGKIVVFTYPHVGNYGVNDDDVESSDVTVRGIVVRDLARFHSNFRARRDFRSWVEEKGIVGLTGVDTRAVMVHARDHGIGLGAIAASEDEGLRAMREMDSPFERNLVATVQGICRLPWGTGDRGQETDDTHTETSETDPRPLTPDSRVHLAVLDLGGKYSLYRQLAELGCALHFYPWDAQAEAIVASGVDAVLLPSGPGDPNRLGTVAREVARLLGRLPVLGIGLGFQLLSIALGARVVRLNAGRHGVNYPVRSTRGEPSLIASCHQSFAVDPTSVPPAVAITYVHLNEGTPMGLEATGLHAWGYQFHPTRDGDNRPSPLLARFVETLPADASGGGESRGAGVPMAGFGVPPKPPLPTTVEEEEDHA